MLQVLFRIPVQVDWLPDFLPLPLLVFIVFLLGAAILWFVIAPREPFQHSSESWQSAAKWVLGLGAVLGIGMYTASRWWPTGIPVHGFGMMLFVAFLLCNWVAGWLAAGTSFLTVARGAKAGKEFLGATYPAEERVRRGQDLIQDTSVVLFIGGLLGARITYLLKETQVNSVWDFLLALPMIWEGGIIFYGSVIGGVVVYAGWYLYLWYFRNIRIDTLKLADIAAPALALGLCLGRIGCLLNGCCYGQVACSTCVATPIHFPLSAPSRYSLVSSGYQTAAGFTFAESQSPRGEGAIVGEVQPGSAAAAAGLRPGDVIVAANGKEVQSPDNLGDLLSMDQWPRGGRQLSLVVRDPQKDQRTLSFTPFTIGLYPTQVYESVSMFILFWVLLAFFPIRMADGQVMALMMMCYAVHRWLNELLRNDPRPEGFESYTSVGLLGAGIALFVWLYFRQKGVRKA